MNPLYVSDNSDFTLYHGDCREIVPMLTEQFDMIFADPPYFLSNGGISYQSGQIVSVNKGEWDKSQGREADNEFNRAWLTACRRVLKDNGTIWISGTYHNIFSVANCLTELGYRILNVVTWAKTNPPPNISCRFFTYSSEFVIWARKWDKRPHYYNYDLMRQLNAGTQMTDVWRLPAIAPWEKSQGKHPTQKPLRLLHRIVLASTREGDLVLDPFTGSSTTGIAANLLGRRFVGIDKEAQFLDMSRRRRIEIEDPAMARSMLLKLYDNPDEATVLVNHARPGLREKMIEQGICYLRAGDAKGSLLVRPGFERMQYLLLHTGGEHQQMFRLQAKGRFQIWTRETLEQYGFAPEHAPYYVVLRFDPHAPIAIKNPLPMREGTSTYVPKIKPLSEFVI